jgi:hypothetical protein
MKSEGRATARLALAHWGMAAMRPGCIPAWWYNLRYKPNPRRLFDAEWPDDVRWEEERPNMIRAKYRYRPWYPAWERGITWYELCRERENMTAPNRDIKTTATG